MKRTFGPGFRPRAAWNAAASYDGDAVGGFIGAAVGGGNKAKQIDCLVFACDDDPAAVLKKTRGLFGRTKQPGGNTALASTLIALVVVPLPPRPRRWAPIAHRTKVSSRVVPWVQYPLDDN